MRAASGTTSIVKDRRLAIVLIGLLAGAARAGGDAGLALQYVAIVSRHGVRAPTWENARLNAYAAEPWPEWEVPPGNLTPHGRKLMELMGRYYRERLSGEHLLRRSGCGDASRVYIRADVDQRTVETGRALAAGLLPECGAEVHTAGEGRPDPLFAGFGTADPERLLGAVRERLGADPDKLLKEHRAALETMQSILGRGLDPAARVSVGLKGKSVEMTGPLSTGSTFSENLLLEYANGLEGGSLGWGRMTREDLERVMELHAVYADVMRRTPYLARVRGSNLLSHILNSLEQAVTGKATAGALGRPGDVLLVMAGHDTNLSNLSGMLDLSWKLEGYQRDDTPPGGALIFSLWRGAGAGEYFVRLHYVAQTLEQMRSAAPLSVATPPEEQEVFLPGCGARPCPWETARRALAGAIDAGFVGRE